VRDAGQLRVPSKRASTIIEMFGNTLDLPQDYLMVNAIILETFVAKLAQTTYI
jgi:hypothetical protein